MDQTMILPECSLFLIAFGVANLLFDISDAVLEDFYVINNHCLLRVTTDHTMEENDPEVLLLTCPHCKTRCNSTSSLFNHMEFPGNDCLAHLGMDMKQFKKKFNSRQVVARRCKEDHNRKAREKVSPRNPY